MKIMRTLFLAILCSSVDLTYAHPVEESGSDSFFLNLIWKCSRSEDIGNCLKLKAAKLLDKLVRMKEPLVITEYLSLTKDPKIPELSYKEALNESNPEADRGKTEHGKHLDRLIWEKLISLFTTRIIQLNLSPNMLEGRGKEDKIFKKGHGFFLMAAMMGGMMMKMALGKIALIAGKALIIGKIALILSLIIALKKFASQGGGEHPEVVYTSSEHNGGRKFKDNLLWNEDGGDLAYNAHKRETQNQL